eukprot:SAG22_NODE_5608_length_985_cov_1.255079_1_plen_285_part_00
MGVEWYADVDSSTLAAGAAIFVLAVSAAVVVQGFRALSGSAASQRLRPRPAGGGAAVEDWLLGSTTRPHVVQGLPGVQVKCDGTGSAAAADLGVWSADEPPALATDGPSHLWGLLPRRLFPDIVIRPAAVVIDAPPEAVWEVFVDFDRYSEWNPFHRKVEVVEQQVGERGSGGAPPGKPATTVSVRMTVAMGPLLGTIVSTERVCYVDSARHILMYSAAHPSALRMAWLLPAAGGKKTVFHSYDMIGGFPALFSRGHIVGVVHRGFTAQHEALRARVHALHGNG